MSVKRKVPMRQCIGCREMKSKKELLRILRTPEGQFVIDATGKKNGRGAYQGGGEVQRVGTLIPVRRVRRGLRRIAKGV